MDEQFRPMEGSNVQWCEVVDAARALFVVWCDGSELAWAECGWHMLAAAGLTRYGNAIERTRVLLRLVALAMIYRDFCQVGRDESWDASTLIIEATEELELSWVRIGQLAGLRWEADTFDSTNERPAKSGKWVEELVRSTYFVAATLKFRGGIDG